jgi:hypothetical protein
LQGPARTKCIRRRSSDRRKLAQPREIVADLSGGAAHVPTVLHEVVHALLHADFPFAPPSLEEGLATLFEAPVVPADGGIGGEAKNRRAPRLQAALSSPHERSEARLDVLFDMPADVFNAKSYEGAAVDESKVSLHYAMARAVTAWLDAQGKLWPFYRAWRDHYYDDPWGKDAFRRVTGKKPKEANDAWVAWSR